MEGWGGCCCCASAGKQGFGILAPLQPACFIGHRMQGRGHGVPKSSRARCQSGPNPAQQQGRHGRPGQGRPGPGTHPLLLLWHAGTTSCSSTSWVVAVLPTAAASTLKKRTDMPTGGRSPADVLGSWEGSVRSTPSARNRDRMACQCDSVIAGAAGDLEAVAAAAAASADAAVGDGAVGVMVVVV